jgi:alkylation response protein AidB-like acyl-CoA dehydrogenase
MPNVIAQHFLDDLAIHARKADEVPIWPAASWRIVEQLGGLRWTIPKSHGGDELSGIDLLARYESLAGACLTTCFILSQRDAACWRLHALGNDRLCGELFPGLLSGEKVITVGIAQLTTSRQHGKTAVSARFDGDHLVINGVIPWVTGAPRADWILAGAVLDDRQQVLFVLPADSPGVTIGPCLELAALQGSVTAEVRCEAVRLASKWLLAGPAEHVLQTDRGAGSLQTSCLALGLASEAIKYLAEEAQRRPEISQHHQRLRDAYEKLRRRMVDLADGSSTTDAIQALRAEANALVLRSTQAALAVSKGTGFLRQHPVQRWARQALFFLVWSCPWPVTAATMDWLTL